MDKQQDWKKLLKADPTGWLLEPDDPGVRYLALRDIVEAGEKEIKDARRKAHREGRIPAILDAMAPEGWWVHTGNVYTPKCQGTSWSILALAQTGASVEEDKRVASACSYLLEHALAKGGQFSSGGEAFKTVNCFQGNMLTSLMDLGCRDERLDTAYEWTACTVTGEGLPAKVTKEGLIAAGSSSGRLFPFNYVTGPLFSCRSITHCAWAGAKIMLAFSRLPAARCSPAVKRAIEAGVDYFFSSDPATADFPGETASKPDRRWWKFHFPVAGMDLLQVAEALTGLGYGADPRLANTLELIRSKQDDDGKWLLEKNYGYWHKWWFNPGSFNKPNKWVTLRAMRVLKQAAMQKRQQSGG
ncbi:MAG: nitrogen fixation protein NifH [Dehalococcoidales bacterium]|nr:nitrogen fixation protein NifH [Dehalococcoidales bacterium]